MSLIDVDVSWAILDVFRLRVELVPIRFTLVTYGILVEMLYFPPTPQLGGSKRR
jgi:hypothetical protein